MALCLVTIYSVTEFVVFHSLDMAHRESWLFTTPFFLSLVPVIVRALIINIVSGHQADAELDQRENLNQAECPVVLMLR